MRRRAATRGGRGSVAGTPPNPLGYPTLRHRSTGSCPRPLIAPGTFLAPAPAGRRRRLPAFWTAFLNCGWREDPAMLFRLIVSEAPDLTAIKVAGRLGGSSIHRLGDACRAARRPLVLDLSELMSA